jgi:GAF domain-containing protein
MLAWLKARVLGAFNALVEKGIVLVIPLGALALWRWGSGDVTLPVWLFVLIVGLPLGLLVVRRVAARSSTETAAAVGELERQNALYGYYALHLWDVLETLQKVITGDIDVTIDQFMEQGVLGPAREFLQQAPGEDIRLSVLVPEGEDFRMEWAAGHRLASKAAFRLPIAHSFSKIALESGETAGSHDVAQDPRFAPHPRAERPYSSIISIPIRSGEDVVAVFNVISTQPYAFTLPDLVFVSLLGAFIDVVWARGLEDDEQPALPAGDDRGDV